MELTDYFEPHHEKTCFMHIQKQRGRSTDRFVLDLVRKPKDRFPHDTSRLSEENFMVIMLQIIIRFFIKILARLAWANGSKVSL